MNLMIDICVLLLAFFVHLAIAIIVDIAINSKQTKPPYANVFAIKNALIFLRRVNTNCCCRFCYSSLRIVIVIIIVTERWSMSLTD